MGRRKKWISKVKRALGAGHKKLRCVNPGEVIENADTNVHVSQRLEQEPDMHVIRAVDENAVVDIPWSILEEPYLAPVGQNVSKVIEVETEQSDHDESASVEVVRGENDRVQNASIEIVEVIDSTHVGEKLDEKSAAISIQMAFRRYKAKRRLKALVQGSSTKRQTTTTLQCMQTISRVQSQIRARRIRLSEENQALQRQLQQKHMKEMETMKLNIGDDWNDSTKSKEKLEASLRHRQEAAMRRERALAYAQASQRKWKNGTKVANPIYMDPINPHWGWNWLDRWMDARPWENTTVVNNDGATTTPVFQPLSVNEISKAYYTHRDRHPETPTKPPLLIIPQRPSRISVRAPPKMSSSPYTPKLKSPSIKSTDSGDEFSSPKSICSVQTCKQQRRHSISSSLLSPRTLASAEAHKARLQKSSSSSGNTHERLETGSSRNASVKKHESSPSTNLFRARRHSGPPKVDVMSIKRMSLMPTREDNGATPTA